MVLCSKGIVIVLSIDLPMDITVAFSQKIIKRIIRPCESRIVTKMSHLANLSQLNTKESY